MTDAWRVLPDAHVGARRLMVAAVFDGVDGMPNGGKAARAAAAALEDALAEGMDGVLGRLDAVAQDAGGASTAVVVALDPTGADGGLACVGDSSAYVLSGDRLRRITPRDVSGLALADHLGHGGVEGHVLPLALGKAPLLLCTDGVDGVVGAQELEDLLRAPAGIRDVAFEMLFEQVLARGAPDNATAILVSRS